MPPKKQITKEQIVNKAYELVQKSGFECLTARNLAKELDCSTQPIYQSFQDMNELKVSLTKKAIERMMQYIKSNSDANQPPILSKIIGYVQFASEEKYLFQLIFAPNSLDLVNTKSLVPVNNELELNMLIYAHGIVMMKAFGTLQLPWNHIREMIINAYNCFQNNENPGGVFYEGRD